MRDRTIACRIPAISRYNMELKGYLKENNVPHTWQVDGNARDAKYWKNTLYYFPQHVFR